MERVAPASEAILPSTHARRPRAWDVGQCIAARSSAAHDTAWAITGVAVPEALGAVRARSIEA
jgi:hypothetical protein